METTGIFILFLGMNINWNMKDTLENLKRSQGSLSMDMSVQELLWKICTQRQQERRVQLLSAFIGFPLLIQRKKLSKCSCRSCGYSNSAELYSFLKSAVTASNDIYVNSVHSSWYKLYKLYICRCLNSSFTKRTVAAISCLGFNVN